jgi:uncharacterized protein YciI
MAFFLCRLNPPRPSFAHDMTPDEAALMAAHAAYWRDHAEAGRAVIFGPVLEPAGPWGLGIVEADDRAQVEALTAADPVVQAGLGMAYDIHPMMSAILRPALQRQPL